MEDQEELARQIGGVISDLIEKGFELPIIAVAVSVNGSVVVARYRQPTAGEGLICDALAQHYEDQVFRTPINLMFTDAEGDAARVVINKPDTEPRFVN